MEAAKKSNIVLVDWDQFQEIFYHRWVQSMTEKLYEYADVIFDYMDVLHDRMQKVDWTKDNQDIHRRLMTRSIIYIGANRWSLAGDCDIAFPMEIPNPENKQGEILSLNNYREYFDIAFSAAPLLIVEWCEFFGERNE
jgi:hypothetical protein